MKSTNVYSRKILSITELTGLLLLLVATFIMLALLTFHPGDYGGLSYPDNKVVFNKAGKVGAIISFFLLLHFGLSSYLIPILTAVVGYFLFIKAKLKFLVIKVISGILALFSAAAILSLSFIPMTLENFSKIGAGGLYGLAIGKFLSVYFGVWGSVIILGFVLFLSLCLATNWLLLSAVKFVGVLIFKMADLGYNRFFKVVTLPVTINIMKYLPGVIINFFRFIYNGVGNFVNILLRKIKKERSVDVKCEPVQHIPENLIEESEISLEDKQCVLPAEKSCVKEKDENKLYVLPPIKLLDTAIEENISSTIHEKVDYRENIKLIEDTLSSFDIVAKVVNIEKGPVVTTYELELAQGVRVHKVINIADDLAIALKAPNVRIIAPIPGKSTVGLEVPNVYTDVVRLRELLPLREVNKFSLPLFLGKNAAGEPIIADLNSMPHLLIAGTTGSGKSVCLNSIISSLLFTKRCDELKFILIDPKIVELLAYKDIPHLYTPVISDMKLVPPILEWLCREMDERYRLFADLGIKKIETYNSTSKRELQKRLQDSEDELPEIPYPLPYIIVIIDELADLMFVLSKEIESTITRLSQKSRAVGIHLVIATQRPSVDVITGLIKSNIPARIAFKVASKVDSRTILDRNGAEKLLGRGDMLLMLPGSYEPIRGQCTYISENEIKVLVDYVKSLGKPQYLEDIFYSENNSDSCDLGINDELLEEAVKIVVTYQRGSVSLLQRKLGIGYCRAARLIEAMEAKGIVGSYKGSKAREVIAKPTEIEQILKRLNEGSNA